MDEKEKNLKKVRFGLALKRAMEGNLSSTGKGSLNSTPQIISARQLESSSGIPHPSILHIINGKKNPSWSTIAALLEGLEINVETFGAIYDSLGDKEVNDHNKTVEKKKQLRNKKNASPK